MNKLLNNIPVNRVPIQNTKINERFKELLEKTNTKITEIDTIPTPRLKNIVYKKQAKARVSDLEAICHFFNNKTESVVTVDYLLGTSNEMSKDKDGVTIINPFAGYNPDSSWNSPPKVLLIVGE